MDYRIDTDSQIISLFNLLGKGERYIQYLQSENIYHDPRVIRYDVLGFDYYYYDSKVFAIESSSSFIESEIHNYNSDDSSLRLFGKIINDLVKNCAIREGKIICEMFKYHVHYKNKQFHALPTKQLLLHYPDSNIKFTSDSFNSLFDKLKKFRDEKLNIHIHVGLPKTGTTFMQTHVFPFMTNVHYLSWNEYYFSNKFQKIKYMNPMIHTEEIWEAHIKYCYTFDEYNLLISDESLTNPWDCAKAVWPSAHALKRIFKNAKIILTLREQKSLFESLYCQSIKRGSWYNPREFIRVSNENNNFIEFDDKISSHIDIKYFEYSQLIEHYIYLFGEQSVKICIYENMVKDINTYVNEYCEFIGSKIHTKIPSIRENKSMGRLSISTLRILNRLIYKKNKKLGILPEQPFKNKLEFYIKNIDKYWPVNTGSNSKNYFNKIKRVLLTKSLEISNVCLVGNITVVLDRICYMKPIIFDGNDINMIQNRYKHSNELINKKI